MRFAWPFAFLLALAALLGVGLQKDPRAPASVTLDRPAPALGLPLLHDPQQRLELQALRGQVWLLNVWASWCGPCREELPELGRLAARDALPLYGLNYKDQGEAAWGLLRIHGNPYRATAVDGDGRVGLDYGVAGVPETFVIDAQGRIRYRHAGPMTAQVWDRELMPVVRSLQ